MELTLALQSVSRSLHLTDLEAVTIGKSCASTYRARLGSRPVYLKVAPASAGELRRERRALEWLSGVAPVPRILAYALHDDQEFLLTEALAGRMACDELFRGRIENVVEALGSSMRRLHETPIEGCPLDERLMLKLVQARRNVESGAVDESDFQPEHLGITAAALYELMLPLRPVSEDLVLTHGDHCLPNILLDPRTAQAVGMVDVGRAGVADRHQDIALCARSLGANWGAEYVDLLLDTYGRELIDPARMKFYTMLDEFF